MVRRLSSVLGLLSCFMLTSAFAGANSVDVLTFTGVKDGQQIGNFYNGGSGNPNIPNYGITFSSNIFGVQSEFLGGAGGFMPDATQTPAIFVMGKTGSPVTGYMNVAGGFGTGINFFYTAAFQETATVWSGANGTGTVLATISLASNDASCSTVSYCNWTNVGLNFSGTAQSVTFSGPANGIGISDIVVGQTHSILPEPSSIYLLGTGMVGLCLKGLRRFRRG